MSGISGYSPDKDFISKLNKEIKKEKYLGTGPSTGRFIRFKISDESMTPSLLFDDRVTVEPVGINEIKVGNLVMVRIEDRITIRRAHRFLVEEDDMFLITKADNKTDEEKPINDLGIIGKVIKLERNNVEIKVPDTSRFIDALLNFKNLSPGQIVKETFSRLMPFTSRSKQSQ